MTVLRVSEDSLPLGLYSEKGGVGRTLLEKMSQHEMPLSSPSKAKKFPSSSTSQDRNIFLKGIW